MKEYKVEVVEVFKRVVSVKADSKYEATEKVEEQYLNEDIVLDFNDFCGPVEIKAIG